MTADRYDCITTNRAEPPLGNVQQQHAFLCEARCRNRGWAYRDYNWTNVVLTLPLCLHTFQGEVVVFVYFRFYLSFLPFLSGRRIYDGVLDKRMRTCVCVCGRAHMPCRSLRVSGCPWAWTYLMEKRIWIPFLMGWCEQKSHVEVGVGLGQLIKSLIFGE